MVLLCCLLPAWLRHMCVVAFLLQHHKGRSASLSTLPPGAWTTTGLMRYGMRMYVHAGLDFRAEASFISGLPGCCEVKSWQGLIS